MINPWTWNITDIIANIPTNFGMGDSWLLYVFIALILGILIGGLIKGVAKLVLGVMMLSGLVVLVLLLMQKQDILSMIASVIFGIIILVSSFLVKLGKYPVPKR